nr:polygalacturonate 4-alpha-galacturonosyltransferase-like [Ipomoea batatas]
MNARAENPSPVEGQHIEQLQQEIQVMKQKIDCLEASKRRLLGLGLGSSTFEEVELIEQHVQRSVNIIRARKMKIFKDSIEQLEEKGKVLTAENAMLWEKYNGLEPHKVSKEEDDESHDSTLYVNGGDEKSDVETELFIGLPLEGKVMASKKGLSGVNSNHRNRGGGSRFPVVVLIFCSCIAPLMFFIGRGLYTSGSIDKNHVSTTSGQMVFAIIKASTDDLGPLSLDSFRKSNLSASWRFVGQVSLARRNRSISLESNVKIGIMRKETSKGKTDEYLHEDDSQFVDEPVKVARRNGKGQKPVEFILMTCTNVFYAMHMFMRACVCIFHFSDCFNHKGHDIYICSITLQQLRQKKREKRAADLAKQDDEVTVKLENAAMERSKSVDSAVLGKYSIWRRENENENPDSTVRLMRDQVIMARVYLSIAGMKKKSDLAQELQQRLKESQRALGEASSDSDLPRSSHEKIKTMGHVLTKAREQLYDCKLVTGKLRAMLQTADEEVRSLKRQSTFLSQLAAKTIPNGIHCLSMRLTIDYYLLPPEKREFPRSENLENPNLYHYALFSDNVLAASVVVNSTIMNAKEPEKHVFHLVTDKLNFGAMNMWFLLNPPGKATIHVENVDEFKWLNSSYCVVLRQLESAAMKEYYFKAAHPTTLSAGSSNLKYRNPKYLSMLNHLRFYLPEVYPKLDKILFLDDDIVVQKDLTRLWSVDLHGKVNGAVETCGQSFHRFDKYLNFSNPHIARHFDPNACGWAYGMNMFDLKEWKKKDITGIYHKWQNMNEDRALWKLGTLPPGLITFYGLTHPLEKSWHVLGLGYNPSIDRSEIDNAAVIHYNGNMKPWLELAMAKYRPYWTKYIKFDHPYIRGCKRGFWTCFVIAVENFFHRVFLLP